MKSALLVGTNDDPETADDLYGCLSDATTMYDVPVKCIGFTPRTSDVGIWNYLILLQESKIVVWTYVPLAHEV